MSISKPNFFIVGAPKAGTTSLYAYLRSHPAVFMPETIKEPDYFSHKSILAQNLYYKTTHITELEDYLALFADADAEKAIGEASVSYLYYPDVAQNIYSFNPAAKIIIILREPVERAFSHYLMDNRLGLIKDSFDDVVLEKTTHDRSAMYFQQVVKLGAYGEQITRYLNLFGKDQVKILFYDNLKLDPAGVLSEIFEFLEVDKDFEIDLDQKHNQFVAPKNGLIRKAYQMHELRANISALFPEKLKSKFREILFTDGKKPAISPEAKAFLTEYYKKDVEKVRELSHSGCWFID